MASPIPSFLTSGDVDTTSYYQTLGVGKQATHEEISKRYKRLALKHHPDKNQGRTTEEFVRIKQAYETLTDPGKRALYDKYGAEGVAWVESSGEGAAQMLPLLKFIVSPFFPLLVCLVSCGFMVLCTISPAFLAAKLNGSAVSWFAVFIPLWIAMLMVVGFMVFKAFAGQEPIATQGDESDSLNEEVRYKSFGQKLQIFAILKIVSLFVFTLLEAIYLSGDGSGPALPFIGIGMFELTSLAKCVASSRKSVYDRLMSAPDAVPWSYTAYVAKNFYWLVFRIIFWVLALLKVAGPMSGASWWIVSIPFFVGAWLDCVVMRQTYNRRMEVVVFMTSSLLDAGHDAEEVEQATAALSGKAQAAFLANCCCWLCAVLAAVMVFLKVETVPKMGGGVMLIPVWLVLSCCCCCVICLNFSVCCARGAATSGGYPDPEAGYSDTSAMHDEDDLTGDSYGAFDATPVVVDDNVKPDVDLVIPDRRDDQAPTNDPANPTGSLWDLD